MAPQESRLHLLEVAAEAMLLTTSSFSPERIIVFDWDDTLLASTYVSSLGLRPRYTTESPNIPQEVAMELQQLEKVVIQLLTLALEFGKVVIITAAEAGWVELSASLFLPNTLPIITSSVRVVSARTTYERHFPSSPSQWKLAAFNYELDLADKVQHLLSFGDGASERRALLSVASSQSSNGSSSEEEDDDKEMYGKSMKFITRPSVQELRLQVEMVLGSFEYLCTHPGHLDLELTKPILATA